MRLSVGAPDAYAYVRFPVDPAAPMLVNVLRHRRAKARPPPSLRLVAPRCASLRLVAPRCALMLVNVLRHRRAKARPPCQPAPPAARRAAPDRTFRRAFWRLVAPTGGGDG